jgi:hypothetical protein
MNHNLTDEAPKQTAKLTKLDVQSGEKPLENLTSSTENSSTAHPEEQKTRSAGSNDFSQTTKTKRNPFTGKETRTTRTSDSSTDSEGNRKTTTTDRVDTSRPHFLGSGNTRTSEEHTSTEIQGQPKIKSGFDSNDHAKMIRERNNEILKNQRK